ncbi:hypothetical protein CPLU01_11994 [Colletotrichum plurivorum]|uniref:NACHT domain-containing protein n=1 Tax=Colletotrichum plurivorum TaxID=2175906 RepID=A0A8H6N7P6_9PEZI|nr:hypothetical protein CPLU01_11994 [Colletotrichum plurivorum]
MTSLAIGIWPSWALWIAAAVALLFTAYRSVAPFIARLKPGQRNSRADGLDIVYDPSKNQTAVNPQFEIVAVHGLGAHPEHTWEGKSIDKVKPKVHLLRDLLPRAFPTARILSFSYNSDWLVDAPEKTAQQIGHRLAERLAEHRGEALRLPIIFIGHSFGGIVIKQVRSLLSVCLLHFIEHVTQALCAMARSSSAMEDTRGIIFLGTPHQGSSLSIAASILGKLTALLGSNTALLLTLQSNHNQLSDLEDEFRRVATDKQITSFYETKPTFYLGLSLGCVSLLSHCVESFLTPHSVDTDHAGLNKFNGPDDAAFREIKTVIEKLRAKPLIQQADDVLLDKHYTSARLTIKRLSGEELPMDQCYINLAIVEQVQAKMPQDELEAKDSAPKSSPFSLFARLNVETPSDQNQVQLKDLFGRRKRSDGTEILPRRVLIRGRAGVGKTTLCKKMVHEFVRGGMWRDLFDRVLWVPLRNLKERPAPGYNLEKFFFDEFFRLQGDESGKVFAKETRKDLKHDRTLFILDGWDEVNQIATASSDMSRFLCDELLRQPNIIITSRPYASIPTRDQPIDLELETIGFNPTQVDEYIEKTHDKTDAKKVDEIKTFLQRHELVRSLVRVPIQLDAFCYCWDDNNYGNNKVETMTALYQAIQTSLWRKDIPRLGEERKALNVQTNELKHSDQVLIERDVREEIGFLEHLAFDGLVADRLEFEWADINRTWANEITHDRIRWPGNTLPCLSFLRTSDPSAKSTNQTYHFIHLTFQEYFAARYFARHWNTHRSFESNQQNKEQITPQRFLRKHKYNARYNIMWRFVVGLLDEKEKAGSFFEEIEREPVDVLGPAHQRLVMHCLNEALKLPKRLRRQREEKLLQWVLFERDFTKESTFIRDSEIPEGVLNCALRASGDKTVFLDALSRSQGHLSDATMAALIELFKDENSYVRSSAADALGKQSTLSDATVAALVELFKDEDRNVRRSAADTLGKQSTLSDATITALVELFKDEDSDIRRSATNTLGKQSILSDTTIAALVELLKDEDRFVQRSATDALGNQSTLSDTTIAVLVELLKDEDRFVQSSAADALGNQSTLSDTTIAALVELFKDEDSDIRRSATNNLGKQSILSDTTIAALVELLKDEDRFVRRSAADALGNQSTLSDTTIAALVELLKDEDRYVQWSAANALGNQSTLSDATMAALVELFKDKNSNVRRSAANTMGSQSTLSDATIAALVELFKDENSYVRRSAADALGNQSTLSDATIAALIELFKDEDRYVQWSAANALGNQSTLSDATVAALVELFKDKNSNVRRSAANTLGSQSTLSDATIAALVELLKDEDRFVRRSAADALGNQSTLSDTTIAALVELFKDEDSDIRRSATNTLGKQSILSDTTIAALVELLKDEDRFVRRSAADALGNQSTLSDTTITALVELLKDEDWHVRRSAADALGNQSTLSDATMAALVELFKDKNSDVRRSAANTLGSQLTLSDATIAALVEPLKDEDSDIRLSAANALGKQSTLSDATMAALVELFKDKDWHLQRSAADALGKQSTLSDATITTLVELFKDEDSAVRRSAARAIGKRSTLSDTTIAALVELLKDEDSSVRRSAADALGNQSTLSDTTIAALVELLKDEDRFVQSSAADALGNQSTLSDTTIAALVELLKDEDRYVRWSAADALGNQSTLSDTTIAALVELFKHEDSNASVFSQRHMPNRHFTVCVILKTQDLSIKAF